MHTLGINGFKNIAFRPPLELDVPGYKLRARKAIQDTVIMSVGDKKWDIGEGGGYGILGHNNQTNYSMNVKNE